MSLNMLVVFQSRESLKRHTETILVLSPSVYNKREEVLHLPDGTKVYYMVIANIADFQRVQGMRFQHIELMYDPAEEIYDHLKVLLRHPHQHSL